MHDVFDTLNLGIAKNGFTAAESRALTAHSGRYKVGAALIDPRTGTVLSTGASNPFGGPADLNSMHAEYSAVLAAREQGFDTRGCICVVVALNSRSSQPARCSRPCAHCVRTLNLAGVSHAVFVAKDEANTWRVHAEEITDLHVLARQRAAGQYARMLKLENAHRHVSSVHEPVLLAA